MLVIIRMDTLIIDRYSEMPEGEAKDLIGRLDPYLQENLILNVYQPSPNLCTSKMEEYVISVDAMSPHIRVCCENMYGDEIKVSPCDQAILNRLTSIAQQEYDQDTRDCINRALENFTGNETDDSHP